MLTTIRYFLIVALFFPILAISQEKEEELLTWSPTTKLEWADYNGKPDPKSDAAASTATHLGFEYKIRNNEFSFKITCFFSKDKSWGVVKTDYILSHEQGHFDIAEIHARKLNKKMADFKLNKNSYRTDLDKIYYDILEEKDVMQTNYDNETNYSRDKEKQAEWLKKIEIMLEELNSYAGYNQKSP